METTRNKHITLCLFQVVSGGTTRETSIPLLVSSVVSGGTTEKQASLCLFQALFPEELHEKQAHHFVLVSSVVPTIVTRIERCRYSGNALVTQAIDSILCAVSASFCRHEH